MKFFLSLLLQILICLFYGCPKTQASYTCLVNSAPVNFGAYLPTSGVAKDGQGSVSVVCSPTTLLSVLVNYAVSLGKGSSGTYAQRTLKTGVHPLGYNLYTTNARTTVWGDGTGGTSTVTRTYLLALSPITTTIQVYGRIPSGQNAFVGAYTDTIVVTVNF